MVKIKTAELKLGDEVDVPDELVQQPLTFAQKCDLVDSRDSAWYADWCERDGATEELDVKLNELLSQE